MAAAVEERLQRVFSLVCLEEGELIGDGGNRDLPALLREGKILHEYRRAIVHSVHFYQSWMYVPVVSRQVLHHHALELRLVHQLCGGDLYVRTIVEFVGDEHRLLFIDLRLTGDDLDIDILSRDFGVRSFGSRNVVLGLTSGRLWRGGLCVCLHGERIGAHRSISDVNGGGSNLQAALSFGRKDVGVGSGFLSAAFPVHKNDAAVGGGVGTAEHVEVRQGGRSELADLLRIGSESESEIAIPHVLHRSGESLREERKTERGEEKQK